MGDIVLACGYPPAWVTIYPPAHVAIEPSIHDAHGQVWGCGAIATL